MHLLFGAYYQNEHIKSVAGISHLPVGAFASVGHVRTISKNGLAIATERGLETTRQPVDSRRAGDWSSKPVRIYRIEPERLKCMSAGKLNMSSAVHLG